MTLLIAVLAAFVSTLIWYVRDDRRELNLGLLCLMFWGASIMWLTDAIFEYAELGAQYFTPAASDMLNDSYLGISVVALGLMIWLVSFLYKDPKGVIRKALTTGR